MKTDEQATIQIILNAIEDARKNGHIGNDQARAASVCLQLEGDEAMLANRIVAQGADPASLEYALEGEVSDKVALAHRAGPGIYNRDDPDRTRYLTLCRLSEDEASNTTLRQRLLTFVQSLTDLGATNTWDPDDSYLQECADIELDKILSLNYSWTTIEGVKMRLYKSDRGFASAFWDEQAPQIVAAVLADDPRGAYVAVGTAPGTTLEALGLVLDKVISPTFGIITDSAKVSAIATLPKVGD